MGNLYGFICMTFLCIRDISLNDNMSSAIWLILFPNVADETPFLFKVLKDNVGELDKIV